MNDGTHAYTYDAEGRLVTVDGTAAVYLYDADGRRIRTETPSLTKDFVFDQFGRNILEFNEATRLERRWEIFAGSRAIATYANGTTYWNHPDPLGTVRLRTQVNGTEYQRCSNLPFGDASNCSNTTYDPTSFTGMEQDAETQLNHTWFRQQSPAMGRWMTPDPVNLTDDRAMNPGNTLNKYAYAANNPLKYVDPDGQDITVFYQMGWPTGHIMLSAYNQATGDFAFLSVGPQQHRDPDIPLRPSSGVPGTSEYNLPTSVQDLRSHFSALTIQTSPEVAQQAIDAIRNGAGTGNYSLFGNNCSTACVKLLRQIGISAGVRPVLWSPDTVWRSLYAQYSRASSPFKRFITRTIGAPDLWGTQQTPGVDYGNPQYGFDTFSWLMLMLNAPVTACVSVSGGGADPTPVCNNY